MSWGKDEILDLYRFDIDIDEEYFFIPPIEDEDFMENKNLTELCYFDIDKLGRDIFDKIPKYFMVKQQIASAESCGRGFMDRIMLGRDIDNNLFLVSYGYSLSDKYEGYFNLTVGTLNDILEEYNDEIYSYFAKPLDEEDSEKFEIFAQKYLVGNKKPLLNNKLVLRYSGLNIYTPVYY